MAYFVKGTDIYIQGTIEVLEATYPIQPDGKGGRLVAVMSAGVLYRQDRETVEFRHAVENAGGVIERLPSGSFKGSGTDVETVIVTLDN